jgi:hypothetical protein
MKVIVFITYTHTYKNQGHHHTHSYKRDRLHCKYIQTKALDIAAHTYTQTQQTSLHTYPYSHNHKLTHKYKAMDFAAYSYIHTFIYTHIYTYWFLVERVMIWLMAALERAEQVIVYHMDTLEVNKSPPKIWLELMLVSHHTTGHNHDGQGDRSLSTSGAENTGLSHGS